MWEGDQEMKKLFISQPMNGRTDVAYFAEGWQEARGCKIEHECAVQYGIDRIE